LEPALKLIQFALIVNAFFDSNQGGFLTIHFQVKFLKLIKRP